ncbi:major facilitator superfamily domain-containing protein [Armillaria luteobubalina]|uniref:Major facilitator superfamily domain-containing protein n=1 Tax=Armillaria luteobubalina TaxID=153913 RepID=A0AA39Q6D8_9AGAR|nr:major facilitator superfamily domain-containing protein [Armillaria luteobubalina]
MDTASEQWEKRAHLGLNESEADVAAQFATESDSLDPKEAARLRWKIDKHILPLMCREYDGLMLPRMTFADKTTLGQSSVLGILTGAHLNQTQFNWLGSVFYLSYLVFEYPQSLALQRFPVGKWMSINIFIWSIALTCHAACSSFGGLFAARFILGVCEGAITPGFMIVTSMFYTREEQTQRTGYWFLMNGFAIIFLGFVAFGVLHTKTDNFMPWQWHGLGTAAHFFIRFFFPDSPTTARFLTPDERVKVVQRIKVNQTGVENKTWKRDQFVETFKDPKIWIMVLFAAIGNIVNSLTNQRQLIVSQFGFSTIQTTLIGCVDGVVEILTIWLGITLASFKPIGRGYAGALMYIVAILGALLVNLLPSGNKVGLLFSYWVSIFAIAPFPIFLGWVSGLTSGHTKRITTNALALSYGKRKYQPRNHVPWTLIAACNLASGILLLILRFMLATENKRRDMNQHDDTYDDVYVTHVNADGTTEERKVDKAFLDLTDIQNKDFRYLL